jgi:putative ATP-dependent endonuclease of the OLD family
MYIKTIKISGFKPIPFCAEYTEHEGKEPAQINWCKNTFEIDLQTQSAKLHAIIGPNSSGKSSIFYALDTFFGKTRKLGDEYFNDKNIEKPVIVEITFAGIIPEVKDWHRENCQNIKAQSNGKTEQTTGELTMAVVWIGGDSRTRYEYIRKDGGYHKTGTKGGIKDSDFYQPLLPKYRLISADSRLGDQADPGKNELILDLIDDIIVSTERPRSAVSKIRRKLGELTELVQRETAADQSNWKEIAELEQEISAGLGPITASDPQVRLQIQDNIPQLRDIFIKGKIEIEDGTELDFSQHGLGIQRTFMASVLRVWCERIGHKADYQDYVFAIEEPELYLHPHATRSFITTLGGLAKHDQVLFTTHSSEFVNRVSLDNVIRVQREQSLRKIIQPDLAGLKDKALLKVQRYLIEDRSDMLFGKAVLLVEGQSEHAAFPAFARKIKIDLDRYGVSIVRVDGKGNFETYHHILKAFEIPHVIFGDGDGKHISEEQKYSKLVGEKNVFVLEKDFEFLLVSIFSNNRILEIINECRSQQRTEPLKKISSKLTVANVRSRWWDRVKDLLHETISSEHREHYLEDKEKIKAILNRVAKSVIEHNHTAGISENIRKAKILQDQGKPIVGRAVGEMLTAKEIKKMDIVVNSLQRVVKLAQEGNEP